MNYQDILPTCSKACWQPAYQELTSYRARQDYPKVVEHVYRSNRGLRSARVRQRTRNSNSCAG